MRAHLLELPRRERVELIGERPVLDPQLRVAAVQLQSAREAPAHKIRCTQDQRQVETSAKFTARLPQKHFPPQQRIMSCVFAKNNNVLPRGTEHNASSTSEGVASERSHCREGHSGRHTPWLTRAQWTCCFGACAAWRDAASSPERSDGLFPQRHLRLPVRLVLVLWAKKQNKGTDTCCSCGRRISHFVWANAAFAHINQKRPRPHAGKHWRRHAQTHPVSHRLKFE